MEELQMAHEMQTTNGSFFPTLLWDDWPLDKLLRPVSQPQRATAGIKMLAADVAEHADRYIITLDVPGIKNEDIELSMEANTLSIKIQRAKPAEQENVKYLHRGRWNGSTVQTLGLPETVVSDEVEATLRDGVLTIEVMKQPEKQPRKIAIKSVE